MALEKILLLCGLLLLLFPLICSCKKESVETSPVQTLLSSSLPTVTKTGIATEGQGPQSPSVTPEPGETPLSVSSPTERAVADLSERLEVVPEGIEVISVVTEDFPAQDLGCPNKTPTVDVPGFVMGSEITLQVGDAIYIYRARGRQLVYCGKR